jgi:hypothetical protein
MTRPPVHRERAILVLRAIKWWEGLRPAHWTLEQHLHRPCVNTSAVWDKELAAAVADYVRMSRA